MRRCSNCGNPYCKCASETQYCEVWLPSVKYAEEMEARERNEHHVLEKEAKCHFHLLPLADLEPLVRVYEFGAKKYEEESWRKIEPTEENINRIASALMRHIAEWQEHYQTTGEFATDEESGLPTMAHVMWNAVELMHLERMSKDGKR